MIKFLWQSFGNIDAYKRILTYGVVKTFAYFLFLTILVSGVKSVFSYRALSNFLNENEETICKQIPNFEISSTKITIAEKSPIFVKVDNDERTVIAFSEDFFDSNELKEIPIAFEKNRITISSEYAEQTFFYDQILDTISEYEKAFDIKLLENDNLLKVTPQVAKYILALFKKCLFPILMLGFFSTTFILNAMIWLLLSMPAYMMSLTRVKNFGYFNALKIALLASTTTIVLQTIAFLFTGSENVNPFFALVSFIIIWKVLNLLSLKN